jgi:putative transposase
VKYALIAAQAPARKVAVWCRALEVSRSGFYAWKSRPPGKREQDDARLLEQVRRLHVKHREAYGTRKIWRALADAQIPGGRNRIARLKREHQIQTRRRRRFVVTTQTDRRDWHAPDLVRRRFQAAGTDQVWVGDVTFIPTRKGALYLAMLMDLYSRRIVGWSMSEANDAALISGALEMAVLQRSPPLGLIHHSDRGSNYASRSYRSMLAQRGIRASMGRTGDCYDNAAAESFFSTLKHELVHHVRFENRDHARRELVSYIEGFYNRTRIHQALGYRSPAQYERMSKAA